ncbi:putative non-specific serine/threonine protein kinase [Rosa chinensis]|uniref:Putative non-specific serine/threonine protein kinase n=1 Tax=Rosa chinensis TaxID=74649 RepID=A0A2P6SL35_ROSCH|nr:putative non-specific serine/threonine protein kinase [Rosa chinensis]
MNLNIVLEGKQFCGQCPGGDRTAAMNTLSRDIPPQVIGLSSLSILLNLSQNSLTGSLPTGMGNLKNINAIDISENGFTKEIPETIGNCLSLDFLNLQRNLFQGIIPSSMVSLKGLRHLDLSRNNFSGHMSKDLLTYRDFHS